MINKLLTKLIFCSLFFATLTPVAYSGIFSNDFDFQKEERKSVSELIKGIDSSGKDYSKEIFAVFGMITNLSSLSGSQYGKTIQNNGHFYKHYKNLSQTELNSVARGALVMMKYFTTANTDMALWLEEGKKTGQLPRKIKMSQEVIIAHNFLKSFPDFQKQHDLVAQIKEMESKLGGQQLDKTLYKLLGTIASEATKAQTTRLRTELMEMIEEFCS